MRAAALRRRQVVVAEVAAAVLLQLPVRRQQLFHSFPRTRSQQLVLVAARSKFYLMRGG
jgi:hypothetical protein